MTRVRQMRIRKRRLATGTVFQLDYVDPITRKRIRKHFPSAADAERYYAQQTLDAGTRDPVPAVLAAVTLARYAAEWVTKQAVASRTIESYRDTLRLHIVPVLGPLEVRAITRGHIRALLARKRTDPRSERDPRPLGKHSVRLIRATLSVVLGDAVADGIIERNPAHVLAGERRKRPDRLSRDERRKTIKPLSVADLGTLLRTAETACLPRDRILLLTLADAGLRPGEGLALRWDDVDEARKTLTVERALSKGRIKATKTESTRTVDLTDRLARALAAFQAHAEAEALAEGRIPGPAIFTTETGTPLDHANVARGYRRLLRLAGLGRSRLYDLRHSFACHLLADGAPVTYVAEQMGHASPTTTLTWYARWIPSGDRRWIEQLEASRSGAARAAPGPSAATLSHAGTRALANRLTQDPGSA